MSERKTMVDRLTAPGAACLGLAAILLLAFVSGAGAAKIYPSAGSAAAAFLKIGVGGRAVAMAGAYTAVADGPDAMFWNPAGLALVKGKNLSFTHNDYFAGLAQEYAVYTMPSSLFGLLPEGLKDGTAGFSLNYFYTGRDLERRSGDFEAAGNISASEGKFGAHDLALASGIGFRNGGGLITGFAVKLVGQTIDNRSAGSVALDLGSLYEFEWLGRSWTAGAALKNLGPGIKFTDHRYPLPLTASAGLSHRLPGGGPLLSLDISKPIDNYPSAAVGAELPLGGRLLFRTGYRLRQHGNESGGLSGLAMGLGFVAGQFTFDYALAPFGDLGNTHRLSAAFRFLAPAEKRPAVHKALSGQAPLAGARALALKAERKPLAVTRNGVSSVYRISVAGSTPLRAVSFVAVSRGEAGAQLGLAAGELPAALREKLPAGEGAVFAWQVLSAPEGVGGDLKFDFELPQKEPPAQPEFHYFSGGEWRAAAVKAADCSGELCRYSASAPLGAAYAVVVK